MKISCILAFTSLSCANATQKHLRMTSKENDEKENIFIGNDRALQSNGDGCASTPLYRYEGPSTLISTTGVPFPSQGDVSIAEELVPSTSAYPKIKAVCTLTAADPFSSPPFCSLETTVDSSGDKIMSMGTPPLLSIMGGTGSYEGASGTMVTDETFVRDDSDGTISFGATVNYCLPNNGGGGGNLPCTNSNKFKVKHDGKNKGCSWVAKKSTTRCTMMGKENGESVMAMDSCRQACTSC